MNLVEKDTMTEASTVTTKNLESGSGIDVEVYYQRYGPMVLRRCRRLLHDEDAALDAMQDVFTRVLMNRQRLKDQYPSSLLYRIATNVCLNIIRAQRRYLQDDQEDILFNIAMYEEKEERLHISNLLEHIFKREKKSTREMAVLYYIDGLTYEQVAREVGLSVSGVRKRLRELKNRVTVLKEV